jgi:hypothetical protein
MTTGKPMKAAATRGCRVFYLCCLGFAVKRAHTARGRRSSQTIVKEQLTIEYPANGSFFVPRCLAVWFSGLAAEADRKLNKELMVKPHG